MLQRTCAKRKKQTSKRPYGSHPLFESAGGRKIKMSYFSNCYTPEELKAQYRYWAKELHPDKDGGDTQRFQSMHHEYEYAQLRVDDRRTKNTMPNYFDAKGSYEYFRRSVKFVGVYFNHYYKFIQDYGAEILIDIDHINLIFEKRKMI